MSVINILQQELARKQVEQLEIMGQYYELSERLIEIRKNIIGHSTAIKSLSAVLEEAVKLAKRENPNSEGDK